MGFGSLTFRSLIHFDFPLYTSVKKCYNFILLHAAAQFLGFSGGSEGKASAYNAGDLGSIPGSGRSPGEGNGNPPVLSPGKSHGLRSLVGYSPWGRFMCMCAKSLQSF